MSRFVKCALLSVLLTGCVHTSQSVLTSEYKDRPVPRDEVQVFFPSDTLPPRCTRVALIYAKGEEDWVSNGKLVNKLREKAGELGANAVQLAEVKEASTGAKVAHAFLGTSANKKSQVVALHCPSLMNTEASGDTAAMPVAEPDSSGGKIRLEVKLLR